MSRKYVGDLYDFVYPHTKNELIFDIGSNIGEVTKKFLDRGARVVAVEPQRNLISDSNYDNAIVENVGISDKEGEISFYQCKSSSTISTCLPKWKDRHPKKGFKKIVIPVITLDSLIKKYGIPKYIKIDVEGFEDHVLGGLSVKVDLLSFEYTQGYSEVFKKCCDHLKRLGYRKFETFLKRKIKKSINGRLRTVERFKEVDSIETVESLLSYYQTLDKNIQGDLLAYG